jgi:hypothetical protein
MLAEDKDISTGREGPHEAIRSYWSVGMFTVMPLFKGVKLTKQQTEYFLSISNGYNFTQVHG